MAVCLGYDTQLLTLVCRRFAKHVMQTMRRAAKHAHRRSYPEKDVRLARNARTTSLDLLARVSVLEGIAGVKPGTWVRNVVPEKELIGRSYPEKDIRGVRCQPP